MNRREFFDNAGALAVAAAMKRHGDQLDAGDPHQEIADRYLRMLDLRMLAHA